MWNNVSEQSLGSHVSRHALQVLHYTGTLTHCSEELLLGRGGQLSPHRREVFCEGLFLVLKLSPHMGGCRTWIHVACPYVAPARILQALFTCSGGDRSRGAVPRRAAPRDRCLWRHWSPDSRRAHVPRYLRPSPPYTPLTTPPVHYHSGAYVCAAPTLCTQQCIIVREKLRPYIKGGEVT